MASGKQATVYRRPAPHAPRGRPPRLAILVALRPLQWVKNLLVVAAPAAAGVLGRPPVGERVALTFAAFCCLASATYLFNDLHDREEDRRHPRKRTRPLAAGQLSPAVAALAALLLAGAGLAVCFWLKPALGGVGGGYLLLTTTYTVRWRHVPVADLAAVAGGFVLRALAGGVAVGVPLSRWFVIVTTFGALFLVAGKRYAELQGELIGGERQLASTASRPVRNALYAYSIPYLRFVMGLAAAVAIGAYCLWAFQARSRGVALLYDLTILPFVLCLLRYALLLEQGAGEAPEQLLAGDRFLLISALGWVGLFVGSVYGG